MEITKTISKIGNSYGIIIPNEMLAELGIKGRKKVKLISGNGRIQIEPPEGREDRLLKTAQKYVSKYYDDLKRLAK